MKKVLFTATVDSHIKNFHTPYLKYFKDKGFEVHVASNGTSEILSTDVKHNVPFQRSPYHRGNIKAYKQLRKIIFENNFSVIHCNTPMGAVITRLAARKKRDKHVKVIYTAHGFHFFKGAPKINWLLFYPIEKWLSKYTDCLITINNEDYNIAQKKFKAKTTYLIHGVGVDLAKFKPQNTEMKIRERINYGYDENEFILIYVGELSYRKHQDVLIEAVSLLKNKIPNIKLLLVGSGEKLKEYQMLVSKLELEENIEFTGYRNDINKLMMLSDVAVSSSRQEGLPVNIMEAMATGLPIVVSNCRGNRDLIVEGENGYIVEYNDNSKMSSDMAGEIFKLYKSPNLRREISNKSKELVKKYSIEKIKKDMQAVYDIE